MDVDSLAKLEALADELGTVVNWFKVGNQLFTRCGPDSVRILKDRGHKVFLDLKFHDIPNTVARGVESGIAVGADMVNVHASGGPAMLRAAAEAAAGSQMLVLAVTVLTSMDAAELAAVGCQDSAAIQVVRLAKLARDCGLAGVVCSAWEIADLRAACGPDFRLVVPGIRPGGADAGDQKRVMTPAEASEAGADMIVVGRPITAAGSPAGAADAILAELA
jgi:orotidine-5'-phosphate decarboxylase